MVASRSKTVLEGDAASLFQEFAKVIGKAKQFEGQVDRISEASKRATREEKDLARAARAVYEQTRTPQERHMARMKELNRLLQKEKIDQQTYARAVRQSQQSLRGMARARRDAASPRALGHLRDMALGFVGIQAAVNLVTSALNEMSARAEEGAQKIIESHLEVGALAQLAKGDPAKMAKMVEAAGEVYGRGGAATFSEAARVAFQLESAGLLEERGFVAQAAAIAGPEGVSGLVGKAGKVRAAFGVEEAGTMKQLLSKAVAAAAPVTEAGAPDILQAVAKAGGAAKTLGLTDEEVFAAVSLVAQVETPDEAATAVKRMFQQLAMKRPELKGRTLVEMMETIRGEQPSEKELGTLLQARGLTAYRRLAPDALQQRTALIVQGQAEEAITRTIEVGEESPIVKSSRFRKQQEAQQELNRHDQSIAQNWLEAERSAFRRQMEERDVPRPVRWIAERFHGLATWTLGEERLYRWEQERAEKLGLTVWEMREAEIEAGPGFLGAPQGTPSPRTNQPDGKAVDVLEEIRDDTKRAADNATRPVVADPN